MNLNLRGKPKLLIVLSLCFFALAGNAAEQEGTITVNFADADVRYVLDTLAKQRGLSIVLSDKVQGNINIRFEDVPFWDAFEAILEVKGFGYERVGRIVKVATFEELESQRKEKEKVICRMEIEIFRLRFANAREIEKTVKTFLSSKGSTAIHYGTVRGGWTVAGIGQGEAGVVPRAEDKNEPFPMILIVRDFPENIEKIRVIIEQLDESPKQVLIEALIAEVGYDRERGVGIDWKSLGQTGAEGEGAFIVGKGKEIAGEIVGGKVMGEKIALPIKGFTGGLALTYRHLTGAKFEAVIRALEQEDKANILSRPRMLVLNGHEGTIHVGKKYPIFSTILSPDTGRPVSDSIDRYEPIGVMLQVVPVIWENGRVNLAIHPRVTALGNNVAGPFTVTKEIITREVDTNITVNSGDTVVIGGLIKSEDKISQYRVPFLGRIPILGWFFRRENKTIEKTELFIFITPSIIKEAVLTESEQTRFSESQESLKEEIK